MAPLPRRASIWRLDTLLAPRGTAANGDDDTGPRTSTDAADEETTGYYDELVRATLASVVSRASSDSQRYPCGGWAISLATLRWFVALAAEHRVSEQLLVATLRDANTRRVFRDDAYDFERSHFEHFLRSSDDEQRKAVLVLGPVAARE